MLQTYFLIHTSTHSIRSNKSSERECEVRAAIAAIRGKQLIKRCCYVEMRYGMARSKNMCK